MRHTEPMPHRRLDLSGSTHALLDAVVAISSDLDLHSVLLRIVESAAELTGAQYAALGVIGRDGDLSDFVTTGLDDAEREAIGAPPHGRGILRLLVDHPEPLRLQDLSAHPASYGFPAHHPPMRTFLGVPVRVRGAVFGNLYLTQKSPVEDAAEPEPGFTDEDVALVEALASAAGFVIGNARAYGLSERRREWLEAAAVLGEHLQPPVDRGDTLVRVAEATRTVGRARAAAVLRLPTGPQAPTIVALACHEAQREAFTDLLEAALPLVAGHVDAVEGPLPEPVDLEVEGQAVVLVPVRTHLTSPVALAVVTDLAHGPQDVEERELLVSFADQAALSLDRAQALAERAQMAVVSDRERIARDLHDVVIQRLFATGLQLQGVGMLTTDREVAARVDRAVDDLDATIRDIRGTIFALRHRSVATLRDELDELVGDAAPLLGFTPLLRTEGPVDTAVPARVREHLLPVLREALSNIARHAEAGAAWVTLGVDDGEVTLRVEDDGRGLPVERVESGLRNAAHRAEGLGGSLELAPREPRGTVLVWRARAGS